MSAEPSKIVHAHVYDPAAPSFFKSKRSDNAILFTVSCTQSHACELFARGECATRKVLGGVCLFGRQTQEGGPTQRARAYRQWVRDAKARHPGVGWLGHPTDKFARIADHIWLPYAHMDAAITGETRFMGDDRCRFIPVADFTPAFVAKLCGARPRAIFDYSEITHYQQKSVPLFVSHLSEALPELLAEAAALSPRIRELTAALTKVGRKAKLSTVIPGIGLFEGWAWDGTRMVSAETARFPPFTKFDATEMSITPGPDAVVTITDDRQVGPDTVLVD